MCFRKERKKEKRVSFFFLLLFSLSLSLQLSLSPIKTYPQHVSVLGHDHLDRLRRRLVKYLDGVRCDGARPFQDPPLAAAGPRGFGPLQVRRAPSDEPGPRVELLDDPQVDAAVGLVPGAPLLGGQRAEPPRSFLFCLGRGRVGGSGARASLFLLAPDPRLRGPVRGGSDSHPDGSQLDGAGAGPRLLLFLFLGMVVEGKGGKNKIR